MARAQTFEGVIIAASTKSVLFHGVYWDAPMWLPTSQVTVEEDEDSVVVTVSGWLSSKRNLNEFTYYDAEAMEKFNE